MSPSNNFSAGPAMAGYLWQVGLALLEILRSPEMHKVEIETDDDVVLRREQGELYAAVQAKHSLGGGTLTTSSSELWKTLRVWAGDAKKPSTKRAKRLVILTTHSVAAGSPLLVLREKAKKTPTALTSLRKRLDVAAKNGGNKDLQSSYQAWASLTEAQRDDVLRRAIIKDAQPALSAMTAELDKALAYRGIRKARVEVFREELLGWFAGLVSERLGTKGVVVTRDELNDRLAELIEQFLPLDLPDTAGALQHPALDEELAANPTYVQQLKLIDAKEPLMTHAVHSHHQATKQRDDWTKLGLVSAPKLARFDHDLTNKWKEVQAFALQTRGIPEATLGLSILQECMRYRGAGLGSQVYAHVSCGSFHMLADVPKLGWHPKYPSLLKAKTKGSGK